MDTEIICYALAVPLGCILAGVGFSIGNAMLIRFITWNATRRIVKLTMAEIKRAGKGKGN